MRYVFFTINPVLLIVKKTSAMWPGKKRKRRREREEGACGFLPTWMLAILLDVFHHVEAYSLLHGRRGAADSGEAHLLDILHREGYVVLPAVFGPHVVESMSAHRNFHLYTRESQAHCEHVQVKQCPPNHRLLDQKTTACTEVRMERE